MQPSKTAGRHWLRGHLQGIAMFYRKIHRKTEVQPSMIGGSTTAPVLTGATQRALVNLRIPATSREFPCVATPIQQHLVQFAPLGEGPQMRSQIKDGLVWEKRSASGCICIHITINCIYHVVTFGLTYYACNVQCPTSKVNPQSC